MTVRVYEPSVEQLNDWRRSALERVGRSAEELEAREARDTLSSDEADALATIRGIDFLLGDDA